MGIGNETLKRAFDAVWEHGYLTRKNLAKLINSSEVSSGRAVDILVNAGLLSLSKGNAAGRVSDIISISKDRLCLLINLCGTNVRFSVIPLSGPIDIHSSPLLSLRDESSNLSIALSNIARYISVNCISLDSIAVAIPNISGSPEPEFFIQALSDCGLCPDVIVSGADAASKSLNSRFAFMSVGQVIWGCSWAEPSRMLDWGKIKVGAHHGESLASVLSYDTDAEHLKVYLKRALSSISTILSPDRLYITSSFLPEAVIDITNEMKLVENVSNRDPIMYGLLRFAGESLFQKFILNL